MAFQGGPGGATIGGAMLQLQIRARLTVFCVDRGTMLPLFLVCGALTLLQAKWCPSCTWGTVSGGGKGASVVPGPIPSHASLMPAGVVTFICVFYYIYLFAWLISAGSHSQTSYVPSLSLHGRKTKQNKTKDRKQAPNIL